MGSQAEYGPHQGALDETAATRPTTLYGITKLSTCLYARHICGDRGIRFAWLRLFSSYGPSDHIAWMIPSLVVQLLQRQRPTLTAGLAALGLHPRQRRGGGTGGGGPNPDR